MILYDCMSVCLSVTWLYDTSCSKSVWTSE